MKTRTTVSDRAPIGTSKQMDTAGNRRFSGTRQRQGQRVSFPIEESLSSSRSRWVTGAESKSATETKEDRGALERVVFEGVTEACNGILGAKKSIEGIVLPVDRTF